MSNGKQKKKVKTYSDLTPSEKKYYKQARKIQSEAKQRRSGGVKSVLSNRRLRGREINKQLQKLKKKGK